MITVEKIALATAALTGLSILVVALCEVASIPDWITVLIGYYLPVGVFGITTLLGLTVALSGSNATERGWGPDGSLARMRRWNGQDWEYRDMTPEEREEAEWWFAIR